MKKLILVLLFIIALPSFAQSVITINTAARQPYHNAELTGYSDQVVTEAFKRIGVEVKIIPVSSNRALKNANDGVDDGNFLRIPGLTKKFPNLVMVPEKLADVKFVVFTKDVEFTPSGWASLKPFNLAVVKGWQIVQKRIKGVVDNLTEVENRDNLFKMLDKDRVEMSFSELYAGYWMKSELGISKKIHALEPPLAQMPMFMYLHKKHEKLVPQLAEALKKMKADGTHQAIFDKTIKPYLPQD